MFEPCNFALLRYPGYALASNRLLPDPVMIDRQWQCLFQVLTPAQPSTFGWRMALKSRD
ncbi:hypothetical protein D3C86_1930840 [compost metagenome]